MKNTVLLSRQEMKNVTGGTRRCTVFFINANGSRGKQILSLDEDAPGSNSAHDVATFWAMSTKKRVGYDCEGV